MNELDVWVCFGGEEPDSIREMLDLVREPEAVDEPDWEALSQRVIESVRGGPVHGASVRAEQGAFDAVGDAKKEEGTESEEALAPTVALFAPAEGPPVSVPALPAPGLPDVVAALLGSGAGGATGAEAVAGAGAAGLPKTSLSLDVAGAMRDRRPAPVVVVEEAPAPQPHTMRVVGIGEAGGEARGEVPGEARREVRADFKTTMMHDGDRIAKAVAARAQPQPAPQPQPQPQLQPTGEGRLSLERYASLLVELRLGYERGGVLERYDLQGEGAMEREEAYWVGRMAREPGVKGALEKAMETWEGYLRGRGGG